ncbi:GumC family protein [Magnetococcales bacterium HHB-1]
MTTQSPYTANNAPKQPTTLFGQSGQQENAPTLMDFWVIIRKNLLSITVLSFVVGILALLITLSIKPIYQSVATLLIESAPANVVSIEEVYGVGNTNHEYYKTQHEILRSRVIAEKVIDKLNLTKQKEFLFPKKATSPGLLSQFTNLLPSYLQLTTTPSSSKEKDKQAAHIYRHKLINAFLSRLYISPVPRSQLVHISFDAYTPQMAAAIPNTLVDSYIEQNLEAKLQMTQKASSWLTDRLAGLRIKLESSERNLQAYRDRHGLVDVQGVRSVAAKELENLSQSLVSARQQRAQTGNIYALVRKHGSNASIQTYMSIPAVVNHPLIQKLKQVEAEKEAKLSELKKRYGARHPKMVAIHSELRSVRAKIKREVKAITSSIAKEFQVARANERILNENYQRVQSKLATINRKEYQLGVLEREVKTNRQLYDMFLTRFKETSAAGDLQTASGRLVDPAIVPHRPAKPRKKLIVLISMVLAFLFGVALAFLMEHLDNTLKTTQEIESFLGIPCLGSLPLARKQIKKHGAGSAFLENPHAIFSESIRTIRTGVVLSGLDTPHKSIMITSSVPQEGKTTFSINLASAMHSMERVLLIDADMRKPSVAKELNLDEEKPGLHDLVSKKATLEETIHLINDNENLHVISAGKPPPNPQELLSSERFASLLKSLEQKYDRVIIDTPPIQAVSDALTIASLTSGMILVVRADYIPIPLIQDTAKKFRAINANVIGSVLNLVMSKKGRYGKKYGKYGYGYRYGGRYGYGYGKYGNYGYGYTGDKDKKKS